MTGTTAATPLGGGTHMQPGQGMPGVDGGAHGGNVGAMQGTAGGEAMGGGIMDPTPVDRKQGACLRPCCILA